MSLIQCPECGHDVSTKAPSCPHCGTAIQNNLKRCPSCRHIVLMNDEQCPHCGARFLMPEKVERAEQPAVPEGTEDSENQEKTENTDRLLSQREPGKPEEPMHPEGKKKRGGGCWWIILVLLLMAGGGGYFYWKHMQQQAEEELAYQRLMDCSEPASFVNFLQAYKNSPHRDEVTARLHALESMEREWKELSSKPEAAKLKAFVTLYPKTVHKPEAQHLIDSLDWKEAEKEGTAAAYENYIKHHPSGEHLTLAYEARKEAFEREQQALKDSIEAAQALDSLVAEDNAVPPIAI